ncbi:zinc finger HIT domain-containing protein 3-like isoform X2 [Watersipora subatra]
METCSEQKTLCQVCSKVEKKYKCPKCNIYYCSLGCYKEHKVTSCEAKSERVAIGKVIDQRLDRCSSESTAGLVDDAQVEELGDRVPLSNLQKLSESEELEKLLHNKHMRDYLTALSKSTNPAKAMEKAMQEPLFLEFANECLKVVEPETCTGALS